MSKVLPVKNINSLRLIARLFPIKYKLNNLIGKYLESQKALAIPYIKNYYIVIKPNLVASSTISNLMFEGVNYLPEYKLLKKIVIKIPKDYVYVDVGANIGTMIWQLADRCGHIYAFEPMPKLNTIIKDSAVYNKFDKLTLYNTAVGSKAGKVQMVDNDNSSVLSGASVTDGITIEVTTLDTELKSINKIDFIKIDVEGFEWEVLKGAVDTIQKHKPALLVELHPIFLKNYGLDFRSVISFLEDHNYKISYYSFLEETRMGRVARLLSRYLPNRGRHFGTKEEFIKDVETLPAKLSYHLYCEYGKA